MIKGIRNGFQEINDTIQENDLSWGLGVFGALLTVFSTPVFIVSMFACSAFFFMGATVEQPSKIDPSLAYLVDKWFWATMLLLSVFVQELGWWLHPATQLERKIGRAAVTEYKYHHGWPWKG